MLSKGSDVTFSQADSVIRGVLGSDEFGTLASSPNLNLNGDDFDDLVVGAAGVDGTLNGLTADAGQVYVINGQSQAYELPPDEQITVLSNSPLGPFVVDPQTGSPEIFGGPEPTVSQPNPGDYDNSGNVDQADYGVWRASFGQTGSGLAADGNGNGVVDTADYIVWRKNLSGHPDNFTLIDDERWYQLTTLGDGAAGDYIRVSPGESAVTTPVRPKDEGTVDYNDQLVEDENLHIGGNDQNVAVLEFDISPYLDIVNDPDVPANVQLKLKVASTSNRFVAPSDISQLTSSGGKVYFTATDNATGNELWVTNGTLEGTYRVTDKVQPGPVGSQPMNLIDVNGTLFFTANHDEANGTVELWKSDGTDAGTVRLDEDILTGIPDDIAQFTTAGGKLYFVAGNVPWESDGTSAGTYDHAPGDSNGDPDDDVYGSLPNLFPQNLTAVESDLEQEPILFMSGFRLDSNGLPNPQLSRVLWASPHDSNDPDSIMQVGDNAIGARHTRPSDMFAFDGLLVMTTIDPSGNPTGLMATNGLQNEGAGSRPGFNVPINIRPTNPASYVLDKDAAPPVSKPIPNDSGLWDGNRDILYFIADDTGGGGRALYNLRITSVLDGRANRDNSSIQLTATKLAVVEGDPQQLTLVGDTLYFTTSTSGRGTELWSVPKAGGTPTRLTDINDGTGDSDPQELTAVNGTLFFIASDGTARNLYRLQDGAPVLIPGSPADPIGLSPAGDRLIFSAAGTLWSTDGDSVISMVTTAIPETTVNVHVLSQAGDGEVTASDRTAPAFTPVEATFVGVDGELVIDLSDVIRTAASGGGGELTLRLEGVAGEDELLILPPANDADLGTRLEIAPQGVVADLVDADGRTLSRDQAVTDIRDLESGTYFLRVHTLEGTAPSAPLQFSIEIDAPTLGNAHGATDRDEIFGGDGDDRIVGGPELDRLFGESGFDTFQAESVEIFDRDTLSGETVDPVGVAEVSNVPIAPVINPQVFDTSDTDPVLRAAVARALGQPVTIGFDGCLLTHHPIFASDAAEIERLDLSDSGVRDLAELASLINLRVLDLANNQLDAGYWSFNQTIDGVGVEGIPGTLTGTTFSPDVPPAIGAGESLAFDGIDDHVDFGDVLDPQDGSYSVSFWFKPNDTNGVQFLASKGNRTSSVVGWSVFLSGAQLECARATGGRRCRRSVRYVDRRNHDRVAPCVHGH